ncbi:MAG: diacylglycerol/lipid kinase family protein, partial [Lachnospiraceae bacterium]
ISAGDELLLDGAFLLCTAANGSHVGGSYRCAPRSKNNDGFLEVCLVRPVSRLRFLFLMKKYEQGTHLEDAAFQRFIIYRRCKALHVSAPEGFTVSLDGEIQKLSQFTAEIVPSAIRFAVPEQTS